MRSARFTIQESGLSSSARVIGITIIGTKHDLPTIKFYKEKIMLPTDKLIYVNVISTDTVSKSPREMLKEPPLHNRFNFEYHQATISKFVLDLIKQFQIPTTYKVIVEKGSDINSALLTILMSEKVDFIITGCEQKGTIKRTLFGSTSEYILRNTQVPVLVVPTHKNT